MPTKLVVADSDEYAGLVPCPRHIDKWFCEMLYGDERWVMDRQRGFVPHLESILKGA